MSSLGDDDTPSGYAAGLAIRGGLRTAKGAVDRAEQVGQGLAAAAADQVTRPTRALVNTVGNVGRGILGAAPSAFNSTPVQDAVAAARPEVYGVSRPAMTAPAPARGTAAPLARPDFSSVAGGAMTLPSASARGAAATGPLSPAGGASAPLPRPGDDNTFTGSNGVTQAVPMPGVGAGAGQPMAAVAPVAGPTQAPQTPAPSQNLSVPGIPLPSVNTGRVVKVDQQRQQLLKEIDSMGFRTRIGGLNSRGKRQFATDLLQLKGTLAGQAGSEATTAAGQTLEAAARVGVATQGEVGQNQRARLSEQGDTARQVLAGQSVDRQIAAQQAGENYRLLNRPTLETGEDRMVYQVAGGEARVVRDPSGTPLRMPAPQLSPDAILQAYSDALTARMEGQPIGAQFDSAQVQAELDASPLGQARAAVLAAGAPAAPPPASAVEHLRQNPSLADAFDRKFGAGAAKRFLTTP